MVPDEWKRIRLNDIAITVTSGSRDWAQYYSETGSRFIRMTNLPRSGIHLKLDNMKYVDVRSDSADGKRTSLRAGDILISITAELGKIGWVSEGLGESFINQHTALVRLDVSKADSKYIAYLLSSTTMNHNINRLNDAGAKAGLNLPTIRSLPIPLPPLPEQTKIAQILSTWDKAIATVEKLIENSKQQKKALMQQLLTGKKRFKEFGEAAKDGELPDGWSEVTLNSIFPVIDSLHQTPQFSEQGMSMVRVTDIKGCELSLKNTIKVSESVYLEYTKKYKPKRGDIVFSRVGSYGNSSYVETSEPFCLGQNTVVANSNSKANGVFIYQALNSSYIDRQIERTVDGSSHKTVSLKIIRELKLILPSSSEQNKIASTLSSLDQQTRYLEKNYSCLVTEKNALMQQLLTGKRRVKVNANEAMSV